MAAGGGIGTGGGGRVVVWSLRSGGRVVAWALGVVAGWSPWCGGRVVARPLWPGGGGGGQRKAAAAERPWRPAGSVCPQERGALLREEVADVHCLLGPCCPSSTRAGRPLGALRRARGLRCAALRTRYASSTCYGANSCFAGGNPTPWRHLETNLVLGAAGDKHPAAQRPRQPAVHPRSR